VSESPEEEQADDTGQFVKAAAILGAILTVGALGLYGSRAAFSVLVGAILAVGNLLTMRAIIRALVRAPDEKNASGGGVAWGLLAILKMVILFGGVWILLSRKLVDPMPLVVGYGALPLGIVASTLWSSLSPKKK
jgi:hypothetical protein